MLCVLAGLFLWRKYEITNYKNGRFTNIANAKSGLRAIADK